VLSVAGLLAVLSLLPGWEGFILRVRKPAFLLREALLFNIRTKRVKHTGRLVGISVTVDGMYTGRLAGTPT